MESEEVTGMEKYGVHEEAPDVLVKTSSPGEFCPVCGLPVERHGTVLKCPCCGTRPFESGKRT